jgi:chromosome segregation ATPase
MKNDRLQVLAQFHREVILPDVQRIVDDVYGKLRNEMYTQFDGVYVRFDRMESEYYALKSWMSRLDERLARIESEVQSLNVRVSHVESELQCVKSHLVALEMRVVDIEKKIDRLATETELVEIRQQIVILNDRIAALETRH